MQASIDIAPTQQFDGEKNIRCRPRTNTGKWFSFNMEKYSRCRTWAHQWKMYRGCTVLTTNLCFCKDRSFKERPSTGRKVRIVSDKTHMFTINLSRSYMEGWKPWFMWTHNGNSYIETLMKPWLFWLYSASLSTRQNPGSYSSLKRDVIHLVTHIIYYRRYSQQNHWLVGWHGIDSLRTTIEMDPNELFPLAGRMSPQRCGVVDWYLPNTISSAWNSLHSRMAGSRKILP